MNRRWYLALCVGIVLWAATPIACQAPRRPNIVLVMADDMGWGQTGYYRHPVLETPSLDAMAANGLRFDRFYAGAPNCSPTRASVLTGRSNDRTGVFNHGFALRAQERTVAQLLKGAGYATAHFGKWHLSGLRGPGVPILATDDHGPGEFGFDTWLSVTNFFDLHPIMSRQGEFEELEGDSSEIVVEEALRFVRANRSEERPFFVVIWYGTPHSPWMALARDEAPFAGLNDESRAHHGELVAMDRSVGTLRRGLRQLGVAENTLLWFCSDNGGLPGIGPDTVSGLRGFKNSLYEGGLRVPAIVEWPAVITEPRTTSFPSVTMDMLPTLAAAVGLVEPDSLEPQDGISLLPLFRGELTHRGKPIPFRHGGRGALVDNDYKLLCPDISQERCELYDLTEDQGESEDLAAKRPAVLKRMRRYYESWNQSVEASVAGRDYPEGRVDPNHPKRRFWTEMPGYEPYFEQWSERPEYRTWLK